MADVAREAGISRQAVYLHFNSRASLFVAVVRHMDEQGDIRRRCEQALSHDDPVEALEAFVLAWLRYAAKIHPVASAFLASRHDDPDAMTAWNDRMGELRAGFRHATQRMATAGRLRPGLDPATAADLAWAMTSIPVWEQLTIDCGRTGETVRRHLAGAVIDAVSTGHTDPSRGPAQEPGDARMSG
ncbi:TetR family transcriptional regulator [Actinoplanes xinjiangensis]|uniref:TetR family transcriptional regulator n=2 Tax=Actinoplanes xinjiangensis TaxID=512350 RepID=A0A316FUL0_9ACTN|nr:TetR family transcriptional regulator [Actinoplanes xinjiangensis]